MRVDAAIATQELAYRRLMIFSYLIQIRQKSELPQLLFDLTPQMPGKCQLVSHGQTGQNQINFLFADQFDQNFSERARVESALDLLSFVSRPRL